MRTRISEQLAAFPFETLEDNPHCVDLLAQGGNESAAYDVIYSLQQQRDILAAEIEEHEAHLHLRDEDVRGIRQQIEQLLIEQDNIQEEIDDGSIKALGKLKECNRSITSKLALLALYVKRGKHLRIRPDALKSMYETLGNRIEYGEDTNLY